MELASIADLFFDEFTDLLERTEVRASPVIIAGDLDVHLDTVGDTAAAKLLHILDMHGLTQHIAQPTHVHGHVLDVLITRAGQQITSVKVDPLLLPDHSLIVASADCRKSLITQSADWLVATGDHLTSTCSYEIYSSRLSCRRRRLMSMNYFTVITKL